MINKKLIKIDVDGEILYYKVDSSSGPEYSWTWTEFYKTNDRFKTFSMFGYSIFTYFTNKEFFRLDYNIESCKITRKTLKMDIIRESIKYKKLKERCDEIKNGDII